MKKWSLMTLIALFSAGTLSCEIKDEPGPSEVEDTIRSFAPKAYDICSTITECADYSYLSYRNFEACLIGVTKPVINVDEDDGEKYVTRIDYDCLDSFNDLLTCENKLSCEDLIEAEYYGNTPGRLSKSCSKEYKALKTCLDNQQSCSCGTCETCSSGTCQAIPGCDPNYWCDADFECGVCQICGSNYHCQNVENCSDVCKYDVDCAQGESCISGKCTATTNTCTDDSQCQADKICMNGVCVEGITPECSKDSECGECASCMDGKCVIQPGCGIQTCEDIVCDECLTCLDGECIPILGCTTTDWCDDDVDCNDCQICYKNQCLDVPNCQIECKVNTDCEDDAICINHKCLQITPDCTSDADCEDDETCENGMCVWINECKTDIDCGYDEACVQGECLQIMEGSCKKDADCSTCGMCWNSSCVLDPYCPYDICSSDEECGACEACSPSHTCAPVLDCQVCDLNSDCPSGSMCSPKGECIAFADDTFNYIRIDDVSGNGGLNVIDPGADIDAIVLSRNKKLYYAESVITYLRADGYFSAKEKDWAADPLKALGAPDSITSIQSIDGTCKYFKDGSNSIGNSVCFDDSGNASCDYDYTFVSLGGTGGYLIVELDSAAGGVKAGDKLYVVEIGDCSLKNTSNGVSSLAKAEHIKVSVTKDLETYKVIGESIAVKSIVSFSITSGMLE